MHVSPFSQWQGTQETIQSPQQSRLRGLALPRHRGPELLPIPIRGLALPQHRGPELLLIRIRGLALPRRRSPQLLPITNHCAELIDSRAATLPERGGFFCSENRCYRNRTVRAESVAQLERSFCVFPRNLAPVFTHYLSERPEMNSHNEGGLKA